MVRVRITENDLVLYNFSRSSLQLTHHTMFSTLCVKRLLVLYSLLASNRVRRLSLAKLGHNIAASIHQTHFYQTEFLHSHPRLLKCYETAGFF